jgi:hypothetical protein
MTDPARPSARDSAARLRAELADLSATTDLVEQRFRNLVHRVALLESAIRLHRDAKQTPDLTLTDHEHDDALWRVLDN